MEFLSFWGKARSTDADGDPGWQPLAFHSLNAAAVGEAFLAAHSGLTDRLCGLAGLSEPKTVALLRFLTCLHNIGKFAGKFQAKLPERFPKCFGIDASKISSRFDHGLGGLRLFSEHLDIFGVLDRLQAKCWLPIVPSVAGHHSSPPDLTAGGGEIKTEFRHSGIEAARAFAERARVLLDPPDPVPQMDDRSRCISRLLAGLAVLSAWIGSNEGWFLFRSPN